MIDRIKFDEEEHKYTNVRTGQIYTSVTTMLAHYKNFNKKFWLMYKTIQYMLGIPDSRKKEFSRMCMQKGMDWKNVSYVPLFRICLERGIDVKSLKEAGIGVLEMWNKKAKAACDKGTLYHDRREIEAYSKGYDTIAGKKAATSYKYSFDLSELGDGFHGELLLYNHDIQLCGKADKTIIETDILGRYLDMDDYKTSKTIDLKNPFTKMKYPLDKYDDCNFNHYTFQINTYVWMLKQFGYVPRNLELTHQRADSKGNGIGKETIYKIPYLPKDTERMLEHFHKHHNIHNK